MRRAASATVLSHNESALCAGSFRIRITLMATQRLLPSSLSSALFALCLSASACGSDTPAGTDAGVADANLGVCTPAASISTYPGNATGNVVGAGANFNVEEDVCDNEISHFPQAGEDQVIALTNLDPGSEYLVQLKSDADLSVYIVSDCTGDDPVAGECLLFTDDALGAEDEVAEFVAPASGTAYAIVDHFSSDGSSLEDGAYTISVLIPQCSEDPDCNVAPNTPYCSDFICVECANSFHCESEGESVCDDDSNACVAGADGCTVEDPGESGDDGPAGATSPAAPGANTPTSISANICSAPLTELDYYSVSVAQGADIAFSLDWPAASEASDLDLYVFNEDGNIVGTSFSQEPEVFVLENAAGGTYYAAIAKYEPDDEPNSESIAYSLTLSVPECDSSFDCPSSAEPTCSSALQCIASTNLCTGDTDDNVSQNDGPAEARNLPGSGASIAGGICNNPRSEVDFYRTTVTNGQSLSIRLDYVESGDADIDLRVFNSVGELVGMSSHQRPEQVDLSYLPAGAYFTEVRYTGAPTSAAHPYTIRATATNGSCTADADCADEFKTQIYRGDCNTGTGACVPINGAGSLLRDVACDSNDDCASGQCSYMDFQDSAELSVCTVTCNVSSECLTAHGPGYSCTVPFATNFCHPDCSSNLDCGALPGSGLVDEGEPWDYLSCNAGSCELDN